MSNPEPIECHRASAIQSVSDGRGQLRASCRQTMIELMRRPGGASAAELGAAVGWQVHSVRGFIAGTLKKRPGASVVTDRSSGATRYYLVQAEEA